MYTIKHKKYSEDGHVPVAPKSTLFLTNSSQTTKNKMYQFP